jgi:hypothetical protein
MGRLCAGILALALFAGPASACINDVELPTHEREFRSEYARSASPVPRAIANPINYWVLVGSGAVLLTGAATVALVGGRSRG